MIFTDTAKRPRRAEKERDGGKDKEKERVLDAYLQKRKIDYANDCEITPFGAIKRDERSIVINGQYIIHYSLYAFLSVWFLATSDLSRTRTRLSKDAGVNTCISERKANDFAKGYWFLDVIDTARR